MKKTNLTIILTLRGRHLHTLRWLWHANRVGIPHHVIVADGEVHPAIDRLLSDPANFSNLSFEYRRYRDLSFSDFYRKCAETTGSVKTKYVMLSDNDDFPIVAGIQKSVEYLDREPEYVCAGGKIPDFIISPLAKLPGEIIGRMVGPRFDHRYDWHDISSASPSERVVDKMNNYQVTYYHVYRTQALKTIHEEIVGQDFSDLYVHEYYIALRTATLGKIRSDASAVCYFRQIGTTSFHAYGDDWVHHLLRSRLPQDYRAMAAAIAAEVARIEGKDPALFSEIILDSYAKKIRTSLGSLMLRHRFPALYRLKERLSWLRSARNILDRFRRGLAANTFWSDLSKDCADESVLSAYRREFSEIENSLQGDIFRRFVESKAPELMQSPLARGPSA